MTGEQDGWSGEGTRRRPGRQSQVLCAVLGSVTKAPYSLSRVSVANLLYPHFPSLSSFLALHLEHQLCEDRHENLWGWLLYAL